MFLEATMALNYHCPVIDPLVTTRGKPVPNSNALQWKSNRLYLPILLISLPIQSGFAIFRNWTMSSWLKILTHYWPVKFMQGKKAKQKLSTVDRHLQFLMLGIRQPISTSNAACWSSMCQMNLIMIRFKNIVSYLGSIPKTIQPAANIEFLQYYNLLIGVINFTFTVSNGCDQFCQFKSISE